MTTISSYSEAYSQLATLFNTGWQEGSPLAYITPIVWPGKSTDMPTDANGEQVSHVRFFVVDGEAEQISIGAPSNNLNRHPGMIAVKIYSKSNQGELPARILADKFCAIFRNVISAGISFKTPYCVTIGENEEGFYQINCFAPFDRDSYL